MKETRPLVIVPRAWRETAPPKWTKFLRHPIQYVLFGSTRRASCNSLQSCNREVSVIEEIHRSCTYVPTADIRYNFLVGGDGRVYEGRGWYIRPTLPTRYGPINNNSLYVAYMGNFQKCDIMENMLKIGHDLIVFGVASGFISTKLLEYRLPP